MSVNINRTIRVCNGKNKRRMFEWNKIETDGDNDVSYNVAGKIIATIFIVYFFTFTSTRN